MLIFYSQVARLFDRPSYMPCDIFGEEILRRNRFISSIFALLAVQCKDNQQIRQVCCKQGLVRYRYVNYEDNVSATTALNNCSHRAMTRINRSEPD